MTDPITSPPLILPGNLSGRQWKRFVRGPDQELLDDLYVPMLSEAERYDRCCAYFSSSVLAAAARGFGKLIERLVAMGEAAPHPAVRLVVNEELDPDDVQAMLETGNTAALDNLLLRRFKPAENLLYEQERLAMLAWLVKQNLLEVRVGVMRKGRGILHGKFGIATDSNGDAIVFSGSGNETAQGLHGNYERLEVSTSWDDPQRYEEYAREFADLWTDAHPDVRTVPLPEAVRYNLIKYAPQHAPTTEPTSTLARQKAAMLWNFIAESPYLPHGDLACDATTLLEQIWPHQRCVVNEVAAAWPDGRLLCDEVGMGKTIEAILVIRRLIAGRGVKRVLILLPAGLLKQWQAELREKGGLLFPRLEGTNTLVWPDDADEKVSGISEALTQDVLLMSRETARTENNLPLLLNAPPWDLVVLDEAHAARRRKPEEGELNSGTLLLDLLRQLQLRKRARGILMLSATPMQINPWEPWDLLAVLGEGGRWLAEFSEVRDFYDTMSAVGAGRCNPPMARRSALLIASDLQFPPLPGANTPEAIAQKLAFAPPSQRANLARWMRHGSPLMRRMHRNTRRTLRQYYEQGLLPDPPPEREVQDVQFDYADPAERRFYDAVRAYIDKRFDALEKEKPGKGFVMTIYSRRVSSSPFAIQRSLERRRDGLLLVAERRAYDENLARQDVPEDLDPDDLPESEGGVRVSSALPSDPAVARAELVEVETLLDSLNARAFRVGDKHCP